jgi:glutamyl-Q tRNA(Asp) synthetase
VTHVVRGADLIDSSPRQIYLQRLLGLPTPRYLHLPIAVDHTGQKLSKQARSRAVDPAEAGLVIRDVLAFLGQNPQPALDRMPPGEVMAWAVENWSRDRLPKAHSILLPDRKWSGNAR